MYYADGSAYEYTRSGWPMVNVGWLDGVHDFPTGVVPQEALEAMVRRASRSELWLMMRGWHYCELCGAESPLYVPHPDSGEPVMLGSGEVRATGADGTRFTAPTLVVHYVTEHGYRPPQAFLDAVVRVPSEDEERFERLVRLASDVWLDDEAVRELLGWLAGAPVGDVWLRRTFQVTRTGDDEYVVEDVSEGSPGVRLYPEVQVVATGDEVRLAVERRD